MQSPLSVGIDIGSTTAKIVITENGKPIYGRYERHLSRVRDKLIGLVTDASEVIGEREFTVAVSGSAGMGFAQAAGVQFVQEVFATAEVVKRLEPDTSCVIELGGEDAKVIFFDGGRDERMNGTCAGGTGAFIDQMAGLLGMTVNEMDDISLEAKDSIPLRRGAGCLQRPTFSRSSTRGRQRRTLPQAYIRR